MATPPRGNEPRQIQITPLDKAAEDYANSFRVLRPYLDFFVVNVSSPNTPNLRQLQDRAALNEILLAIQEVQDSAASATTSAGEPPMPGSTLPASGAKKPIFVKVAPDLTWEAMDEIVQLAQERQLAGIVATNTTISRPTSPDATVEKVYAETGGLSGRPLRARSTEVIRHLYQQTRGKVPIIGVGGIFTAADAWEKITAGASLVQVYTGMVYEGPGIAREIVRGLRQRLADVGLSDLSQAVGLAAGR